MAVIKAFYPNVEYVNEIPDKFYIPLIVQHPNEKLSKSWFYIVCNWHVRFVLLDLLLEQLNY